MTENATEFSKHFDNWEIVSEYNNDIVKHKREMKEVMGSFDLGLRVHAPFSDINPASVNCDVREFSWKRVLDTIEVCGELGIDVVTVHPGYINPITKFQTEIVPELNREFASSLSDAQEEFGVVIGLENMPYGKKIDCAKLTEFLFVTQETGLYLTLDIGHAFMEGTLQEFATIKDRIVNIHIHDNLGSRDEHLALGTGECDFKQVLGSLLPIDNPHFNDSLVIESNNLPDAVDGKRHLEQVLDDIGH